MVLYYKKEWYLLISGGVEGPFTKEEVKNHPMADLETLAKKKYWPLWKRIGEIDELRELFEGKIKKKLFSEKLGTEAALPRYSDPWMFFWIIIGLLAAIYLIYLLWAI